MWTVGLDLGQVSDYSALAVVEHGMEDERCCTLRHLHRFRLGTPYTTIAAQVSELLRTEPLLGSPIVVDQTGVGRAFVDLLKPRTTNPVIPVTITSGSSVKSSKDGFHVPKKSLVYCLQRLLQHQRLRLPRCLSDIALLAEELHQFQVKITEAANEVFGAWRQGTHDDLVLAVALACWFAEQGEDS